MGYLDYAGLQYLWGKLKEKFAPKSHSHDDRYYTESEMNTKLSGKSNTDHTHKNVNDIGNNKPTTFAYSKSGMNYGDYSWLAGWNGYELRAVNKNQFAIADHTHPTSEIYGGNVNYSGWAGPIESAHIDVLRANRLAFLPASGVKVEYSVDGGTTWVDYGATEAQKASLFAMRMGSATPFYTGKHTKKEECTTKDQLRITVTPVDRYASVNMLYLWVSVAGTTATVNISRSTIGAKDTFTDVRTDVHISGWSGPNEIRFSQGTFGGGSTQTSNQYAYRFTLKNKADAKGSVSVMDIRMYGPSAWSVPNNMMEKDHLYNWDTDKNAFFPAQVTATKFNGSSTGVVDYGNAAGATIKVGFNGAGLTKDKLTHIAGYAKDGNQTVIKDVDRGVLQSWLNLNEMINTQLTTGSSTPSDNDFYISQYAGGGATTTTYHRRPISALWNYIKSKADAVYSAKSHTHTKSQITDFPASLKNPTTLTIQTNGATAAIYDGSAAKTVNVTKGNIGLGNVDNTADANKSVKYATSAGSASTAAKATTADTATKANSADYLNFTSNNEINFNGIPLGNHVCFGYRNSSINEYKFNNGNGKGGLAQVTASQFNGKATSAGTADVANSVAWSKVQNKPATYTPAAHTHDDRYYTESEVNTKLNEKLSLSGGTMSGQITKSTGGSWIGDRDRAAIKSSYAGDSSYGAVAAMATKNGYWTMGNLGGNESLIFNYSTNAKYSASKNETSQVYLPAQAGTIITSATIGNQSVNHANSADSATKATTAAKLARSGNTSYPMTFNWSGKSGQPTWLWGGENGADMYVYNPSNFNVRHASSTSKLDGFDGQTGAQTWGVQAGTFVHGEDVDSGSFAFRKNCPASGQLSMVIDGKYYQNEGNYPCVDTSGANMTGYLDFGQTSTGLSWTCANGDIYHLRPYSPNNIFQLTRQNPSGVGEYGVFNAYGDGGVDITAISYLSFTIGGVTKSLLDWTYPGGSIYLSVNATSPAAKFGGTWTQIENLFLYPVPTNTAAGLQGGEASHTLTVAEMPSHTHKTYMAYGDHGAGPNIPIYYKSTNQCDGYATLPDTSAVGGNTAHNNMPPYMTMYAWYRVG